MAPRPGWHSRRSRARSSLGRGQSIHVFRVHRPPAGADQAPKARHGLADVELGTAEWVDWFNNQRLHTAIGDIPPREHETNHYAQHQPRPAAGVNA
ncbi:integrase core domain-containing protein [Streptomyces sp. NPDC001852]|uniref:integrase core domain-containing protein n=1 Tax=Streptomyces sp. NPDC001852 TaxID=3364619 RepID=UPI0036A8D737